MRTDQPETEETGIRSRLTRYFFSDSDDGVQRWGNAIALAGVTLILALTVLGQLNLLLLGMSRPGVEPTGIGSIAGIWEFDLTEKTGIVAGRGQVWSTYSAEVGDRFGSPLTVVAVHSAVDTLVVIPAYMLLALAALAAAVRSEQRTAASKHSTLRMTNAAFVLLATMAASDVSENFLNWLVVRSGFHDPGSLNTFVVTALWLATLLRTLALFGLMALTVLLLASAGRIRSRFRPTLLAMRSEVIAIAVLGASLLIPDQTAHVIRRWRLSHAAITIAFLVVFATSIQWIGAATIRHRRMSEVRTRHHDPPSPKSLLGCYPMIVAVETWTQRHFVVLSTRKLSSQPG